LGGKLAILTQNTLSFVIPKIGLSRKPLNFFAENHKNNIDSWIQSGDIKLQRYVGSVVKTFNTTNSLARF
jgi:hypothetical protein